jgi:hypothetical protein
MIGYNLELLKKNMLMLSNHCTHSSEYHERMDDLRHTTEFYRYRSLELVLIQMNEGRRMT